MRGSRHGLSELEGIPPPLTGAVPVRDSQEEREIDTRRRLC
jgi:hypothetical protein